MSIQTCFTLCNVDKENKLTRYKLTKNISKIGKRITDKITFIINKFSISFAGEYK